MNYAITKATELHDLILEREWADAFGLMWREFYCPTCQRRTWVPPTCRRVVVDPGQGAMTEADTERAIALRREGRHGEANALLASFPGHKYSP